MKIIKKIAAHFSYLSFNGVHLISVLVEDVFLNKLWATEFLATQRTKPFVWGQLLCVCLDELVHFRKERQGMNFK